MPPLDLLPGAPRHLVYGSTVRRDLLLLEVDDKLLEEITDITVTIKGERDGEAVLCTQDKTYALKQVETTNTVLLVEGRAEGNSQAPTPAKGAGPNNNGLLSQIQQNAKADANEKVTAVALCASHLELQQTAPQFAPVHKMLQAHAYGREDESEHMDADGDADMAEGRSREPPSFQDLLDDCQASSSELQEELDRCGAVQLDGLWRAMDGEYVAMLTDMLLLTVQQHGWSLTDVPEAGMCEALGADGYDGRLVRHCLSRLGKPCSSTEEPAWHLGNEQVCMHVARKLLKGQSRWALSEFEERWVEELPQEMQPHVSMLKAEVLTETLSGEHILKYFPESRLSKIPEQRFAQLFQARARWKLDDLEPFLQGLQAPGQSIESLLLRHARGSQPNPNKPVEYGPR
ncbi:hypothetical protein WJX73_004181 [Symbiochloris irregularis]|uniref:Sister chromatid cohesion protein DCC1 n=1 Tax=Symbiochloris irregularis TaxID=706552 RepID=A0AAW1NW28_9CHLO